MTYTATLVLGLIAERPLGAYEMLKVLERVNIRRWYQVSDASIYQAVRKLEGQGYVEGKPVREGNNPEKTIYSATGKGLTVLPEMLLSYIEAPDSPREAIDIAILFLCHIPRDVAIKTLEYRILTLSAEIARSEQMIGSMAPGTDLPFIARLMVRHNLLEKRALATTLTELKDSAAESARWDYFVAKGQ